MRRTASRQSCSNYAWVNPSVAAANLGKSRFLRTVRTFISSSANRSASPGRPSATISSKRRQMATSSSWGWLVVATTIESVCASSTSWRRALTIRRTGHSDPRLTLGIYAQASTDGDRAAADRLADLRLDPSEEASRDKRGMEGA